MRASTELLPPTPLRAPQPNTGSMVRDPGGSLSTLEDVEEDEHLPSTVSVQEYLLGEVSRDGREGGCDSVSPSVPWKHSWSPADSARNPFWSLMAPVVAA